MQNFNNQQFSKNNFRPTPQKKSFKPYILVIVVSVLIGVGVFVFTQNSKKDTSPKEIPAEIKTEQISTEEERDSEYYPSSTPRPSLPPLTKNTDLSAETEKNTPRDFSKDFDGLRDQLK